jgi:hypothetical protein
MADLTKIKIDIQDGVASINDLTLDQAQEIWDRCSAAEGTKRFSRKELYDYLQYFAWCHHFGNSSVKSCASHEQYQKFLKNASEHCGDCTSQPCPCLRCQKQMLEVEAQNALDSMWSGPKGYCDKKCVTECEGVPKEENDEPKVD